MWCPSNSARLLSSGFNSFVMSNEVIGVKAKVKCSSYRPGVAQRVGRGIALLFHDCGTRRGWAVSSTPRPHFTSGKDPVPILQEAGWASEPVWTGGKSRPHWDSIPDHPAVVSCYTDWATRPTVVTVLAVKLLSFKHNWELIYHKY